MCFFHHLALFICRRKNVWNIQEPGKNGATTLTGLVKIGLVRNPFVSTVAIRQRMSAHRTREKIMAESALRESPSGLPYLPIPGKSRVLHELPRHSLPPCPQDFACQPLSFCYSTACPVSAGPKGQADFRESKKGYTLLRKEKSGWIHEVMT